MIVEFVLSNSLRRILVNLRPHSFSVTIDTSTIYNFDACGRLLGAYRGGRNYLRGLDNRVLVKWGGGHGLANRSRCDLGEDEKQSFFAELAGELSAISAAVRTRALRPIAGDLDGAALAHVTKALDSVMSYPALEDDGERFRSIYKPVSILPPDQYLAVVLQASEGCSWNKCTFCDFYRDRPFRIKSPDEFRAHLRDVVRFFGPALPLRSSVFLADANALVIAQERLLALLEIVNAELPVLPTALDGEQRRQWLAEHPGALRGIYSFVDAFTGRRKSAADYHQMARCNLRRVYIGLESGASDLLSFLHKGSTAEDAWRTVQAIKSGGVDVGVILMLGAGGDRYAAEHVRQSAEALNAMTLGERDIIYFSPFVDFEGSEYSKQAAALGIHALSRAQMDAQMAGIRALLRFADAQRRPKMAVYDIREFIY